jgi:hypothetical protein
MALKRRYQEQDVAQELISNSDSDEQLSEGNISPSKQKSTSFVVLSWLCIYGKTGNLYICDSNMTVYLWRDRKFVNVTVSAMHIIVTDVTTGIENVGHKFFMDNFSHP